MNEMIGLILIAIGILYDLLACFGLLRMPDIYTRLQTATKAVTLGTSLILIGAAVYFGPGPAAAKAILCMLFVLLTNPASAHVIARAAHSSGIRVERVTADGLLGREIESEIWDMTRRTDRTEKDRLVKIIETCPIIDLTDRFMSESLFKLVSGTIGKAENISPEIIEQKLLEREKAAVTALKPDFAIPHIIIEGSGSFELIIIRAKNGIWFSEDCPRVTSVFIIAGTQDEWHFYLRTLAAIAQMVRMEDFFEKWLSAEDTPALRQLLLERITTVRKEMREREEE